MYREDDGTVPALEWLAGLPLKARAKCLAWIEQLRACGFELRRPVADLLRDEVYELRLDLDRHDRILYFFHGQIAVLSHGLIKERRVPPRQIDLAVDRKAKFAVHPDRYTFQEP